VRKLAAGCHLCDYKCRDQFQLGVHLKRHAQDRAFVCAICKRAFVSQADCSRHRNNCSGHRRNVCPTCDQTFRNIQLLNRHYLWDSHCGRLRHLNLEPLEDDATGVDSLEIYRLQTDDSDSDIVGARHRHRLNSDDDSGGRLVLASQRRVRCGVCISCSRGVKCLHPVNYYRVGKSAKAATESALSSRLAERREEQGTGLPGWLSDLASPEMDERDDLLQPSCSEIEVG